MAHAALPHGVRRSGVPKYGPDWTPASRGDHYGDSMAIADDPTSTMTTSYWHPFADMGAVSHAELLIERGEGVHVFDAEGTRYLDGTASLWYANLGHGRADITRAVTEQMDRLAAYSTFGDFSNRPSNALAARLAALAPMDDAKVFLASGGGDAIDTAAKIARRHWVLQGRPERVHIVSRTNGYHGTHAFGTSIGGIEANTANWGPLVPHTSAVAFDSLPALEQEILRVGPERVAAFFCEPVIGAGGVHPPPEGYIEGVADLCAEHGILLVIDSVICAFGRLGTWFGIERWPEVRPDMITFAKGVTSGYLPLGGVVVSGDVAAPFFAAPGRAGAAPRRDLRRPPDLLRGRARGARRLRGGGPDRSRPGARGAAARRARAARGALRGRRGPGRRSACSAPSSSPTTRSRPSRARSRRSPPARARPACSCGRCCAAWRSRRR